MRGHNSFIFIITPKDNTQAFKKAENKHSKSHETGSEGHSSALYVIIEVSPPPPWTCTLQSPTPHPIPIYKLFLLPPLFNPPPPSSFRLVPWWWLSSSLHPPQTSSSSAYKEGGGVVSGREEVFVSHKYYESSAGYGIHSIGLQIYIYIFMGTGIHLFIFHNDLKYQAT